MTNVAPVAADVSGFITDIHVKMVKRLRKMIQFYCLSITLPISLSTGKCRLSGRSEKNYRTPKQIDRSNALIKSTEAELNKSKYELGLKQDQDVVEAVSKLEVKNSLMMSKH